MNFSERFMGSIRAGIGVVTSLFCVSGVVSGPAVADSATSGSFFDLEAVGIDGQPFKFASLQGGVVLVVNVASKCGFTSQYEGLEALYQKYKDRGLVIVGFPSNDFMGQEPGTNEDIKSFCSLNYGVSFPLFAKGPVKGAKKQAVYRFLTEQSGSKFAGDPGWNFVKFLVGRDGKVVDRFSSMTTPESEDLIASVERALSVSPPRKGEV